MTGGRAHGTDAGTGVAFSEMVVVAGFSLAASLLPARAGCHLQESGLPRHTRSGNLCHQSSWRTSGGGRAGSTLSDKFTNHWVWVAKRAVYLQKCHLPTFAESFPQLPEAIIQPLCLSGQRILTTSHRVIVTGTLLVDL